MNQPEHPTRPDAAVLPDGPPAIPPAAPPATAVGGPAPPAAPPAPITQPDRLESLDVLRGFAVLGILAMNIMAFSGPFAGYMNPTAWPQPYEGGNRVAYWLTHVIFDTKMMSLFSMLFGAGVVVWGVKALTREQAAGLTWLWLRRMFWLFAIGMAHAWLLWEGDILVTYALTGAILAWWVRRLSVRMLCVIAAALFLVHMAFIALFGWFTWIAFAEHPEPPFGTAQEFAEMQGNIREGMKAGSAPTQAMLEEDIAAHQGSYAQVLGARAPIIIMMQTFLFGTWMFWRAGSMMVLGMILMRTGVFTASRTPRFYAVMAAVCYVVGFGMVIPGTIDSDLHGHNPGRTGIVGTPLNVVGSVPIALGHAAVLLLMIKLGILRAVRRALSATGQMAFTNYLSQTIICTTLFYGYGLGLYGKLDRMPLLGIVAAIWALQVIWSPLWLSKFRFGPAEWLWRSLTYWKPQPMRRARASNEPRA